MPIATGSGCASASIVWLRPSIMCSLPFSVLSIIRKFYPIGNRLRNFSWRRWKKPLLFTPCANSNWFCRCFAFRIGKIHYYHCIVRNFQFRKFLPVNNDKKPPEYGLAAFMNTVLLVCYYYVTSCAYFTAFYGTKTPGNIRFPGVIILRGLGSGKVLTSTCIDLNAVTLVNE